MQTKLESIAILLAGLSLATLAQAQGSLEGAWQLQELMVSGGPNEGTNTDPDQGLPVTDEDRISNYLTFRANSGTYEIFGSKLMLHFMLSLNPAAVGYIDEVEYRVEGDKLITTATPNEGVVIRRTYTRLD